MYLTLSLVIPVSHAFHGFVHVPLDVPVDGPVHGPMDAVVGDVRRDEETTVVLALLSVAPTMYQRFAPPAERTPVRLLSFIPFKYSRDTSLVAHVPVPERLFMLSSPPPPSRGEFIRVRHRDATSRIAVDEDERTQARLR